MQVSSFKSTLEKWLQNVKNNTQTYSQQYKKMTYPDKIGLESQVLQFFTIFSRITNKKLNKNTDLAQQFYQLNEKLTQSIQSTTKTNIYSNKLQEKQTQTTQQQLSKLQTINNFVINKKQPVQKRKLMENIEREKDEISENIINSLRKDLEQAEQYISINNEEFAIEIQMYNQKVWRLEHEIQEFQAALYECNTKIKQYQIIIPKLRADNIRLEAASRMMRTNIERQKRYSHFGSQDKKQRNQPQKSKNSRRLNSQVYQSYTQNHPTYH